MTFANQSLPLADHPLARLDRDDLNLIVQLVLRSGSLKELASDYGVSYPTIRARLDRTIARLRDAIAGVPRDPLAELLATLVERGEVSPGSARAIRDAAREAAVKSVTSANGAAGALPGPGAHGA